MGRGGTGVSGPDGDWFDVSHLSGLPVEKVHSAQLIRLCPAAAALYLYSPGKNEKTGPTLDFLVNVLCCMCIMEALGGVCGRGAVLVLTAGQRAAGGRKQGSCDELQAGTRSQRIFLHCRRTTQRCLRRLFIWVSRAS